MVHKQADDIRLAMAGDAMNWLVLIACEEYASARYNNANFQPIGQSDLKLWSDLFAARCGGAA